MKHQTDETSASNTNSDKNNGTNSSSNNNSSNNNNSCSSTSSPSSSSSSSSPSSSSSNGSRHSPHSSSFSSSSSGGSSSGSTSSNSGSSTSSSPSSNVTAFLSKLWRLVNEQSSNHLICWSQNGCFFIIVNQIQFAKDLLPLYFKHSNMASFIRQLNMYGFRKIPFMNGSGSEADQRTGVAQFYHNNFERGQEHRLANIKRKNNSSKTHNLIFCDQVRLLLSDVRSMRDGQSSAESILSALQVDNKSLWRDISILRSQHYKQRRVIDRIIIFLTSLVHNRTSVIGKKHKMRLMINTAAESASASGAIVLNAGAAPEEAQAQQPAQQPQVSPGSNSSRLSDVSGGPLKCEVVQQFAQSFYQSAGANLGALDDRMSARSYESSFGSSELNGAQAPEFNTFGAFQSDQAEQPAYLSAAGSFAQQQPPPHSLQSHSNGIQVTGSDSFSACAGADDQQMNHANGYRQFWLQQQQQLIASDAAALDQSSVNSGAGSGGGASVNGSASGIVNGTANGIPQMYMDYTS